MATARFSVLLRNGSHRQLSESGNGPPVQWGQGTPKRYGLALKCDNVAISYAKTPIQIPIPQESPELIDLGIFRPSITLSGIVEHSTGISTDPYMEYVSVVGKSSEYSEVGSGNQNDYTARYYLPYKNVLENACMSWITTTATKLECQIGDVDVPTGSGHTGGSIYEIAIQMARFQQNAAQEDRWAFSIQLIAKAREDFNFDAGTI